MCVPYFQSSALYRLVEFPIIRQGNILLRPSEYASVSLVLLTLSLYTLLSNSNSRTEKKRLGWRIPITTRLVQSPDQLELEDDPHRKVVFNIQQVPLINLVEFRDLRLLGSTNNAKSDITYKSLSDELEDT